MKRFEIIKPKINDLYQSITDGTNRQLCIKHHSTVLNEIMKYTDNDCLYVAAYMHDCGLYLGLRGKHAITSANYTKQFLQTVDLFDDDEIQLIYEVIKVHSDKENTHFSEAELLKQADVSAHHLDDL